MPNMPNKMITKYIFLACSNSKIITITLLANLIHVIKSRINMGYFRRLLGFLLVSCCTGVEGEKWGLRTLLQENTGVLGLTWEDIMLECQYLCVHPRIHICTYA